MQVYNTDGTPDQYRRWWGYEGGTVTTAANWAVASDLSVGTREQARLGDSTSVDIFLDQPQPLACLTVCVPFL